MDRIQRLQQQLDTPTFIEQLSDLYYLTGLPVSRGRLYISPTEAIFFVDGRYYERAKKLVPCTVKLWEEQKKISTPLIAFDSAAVTYDTYLSLKKTLPQTDFIPKSNPVRNLRAIKDVSEIAALKKAAKLTWRAYQHILDHLREGITEEELALEFEIFCRKNGASSLSFEPIIAFGENSAYPHYRAGKVKLRKNQVVLIDVGAVVDQYHADMTRIYYFGEPDPRILHFERLVKEAKEKAIAQIKPGVAVGTLDQLVRAEFEKHNVKQLYTHSLGHGVGLETHEFPRLLHDGPDKDILLQPGMTFTIEPGLYQPGVGGVRLEDMILVTPTGHENFFAD